MHSYRCALQFLYLVDKQHCDVMHDLLSRRDYMLLVGTDIFPVGGTHYMKIDWVFVTSFIYERLGHLSNQPLGTLFQHDIKEN